MEVSCPHTMDYKIGQIIIGRGIGKYTQGKVKDFRIVKVGKKYIYVIDAKSDLSVHFSTAIFKDTLKNKERGPVDWEYFSSKIAMEEYDESIRLIKEIRDKASRLSAGNISLERLKKIRDILEKAN